MEKIFLHNKLSMIISPVEIFLIIFGNCVQNVE